MFISTNYDSTERGGHLSACLAAYNSFLLIFRHYLNLFVLLSDAIEVRSGRRPEGRKSLRTMSTWYQGHSAQFILKESRHSWKYTDFWQLYVFPAIPANFVEMFDEKCVIWNWFERTFTIHSLRSEIYLPKLASIQPRTSPPKFGLPLPP